MSAAIWNSAEAVKDIFYDVDMEVACWRVLEGVGGGVRSGALPLQEAILRVLSIRYPEDLCGMCGSTDSQKRALVSESPCVSPSV